MAKFTHESLRSYYIRYGVKFKRPDYKFWKSTAENMDLKAQQLEFVQTLGTYIQKASYDEIIYVNETTFNLW